MSENAHRKEGDGYDTIRVKSELKSRIIRLQNAHFDRASKKISATELLRQALDARDRAVDPLHALVDKILEIKDADAARRAERGLHELLDAAAKRAAGKPGPKRAHKIGGEKKGDPEREE